MERGRQLTEPTLRDSDFASSENLPFPRRHTEWIDDSGHMLHFEQPAVLARLIEEFFLKPIT
jgi:pimeloyl-ACP methyl ester carboxylesterase